MGPGHSEEKRIPRGGAGYANEGELGRQETQSGRRTCVPPTFTIRQDLWVDGATSQNLADLPEPDDGNGGVTSSRKSSQVAFENGNRSGDSRVRVRMCSCSGESGGCADGKEDCVLAPAILLEQRTQETVKEMEELQIARDRESTMVQATTARSEVCSWRVNNLIV